MTVDPAVSEAADNYADLPVNFGSTNSIIRLEQHEAFTAGVTWARSNSGDPREAADEYAGSPFGLDRRDNNIRITAYDAFIAGVEWAQGHATNGSTR